MVIVSYDKTDRNGFLDGFVPNDDYEFALHNEILFIQRLANEGQSGSLARLTNILVSDGMINALMMYRSHTDGSLKIFK